MDELQQLDFDWLAQLLTIVRDAEVSEFQYGPLRVVFPPPRPDPSVEHPMRPTIESPNTPAPNGYVQLLGGKLPSWPKAE